MDIPLVPSPLHAMRNARVGPSTRTAIYLSRARTWLHAPTVSMEHGVFGFQLESKHLEATRAAWNFCPEQQRSRSLLVASTLSNYLMRSDMVVGPL